jgi:tetratricopeptide (TPR) repeat protein
MPDAAPPRQHPDLDPAEQALAEEQLGHWDAAARLYAQAFRGAVQNGQMERAVDALRGQGRVLIREERFDEAEELVNLSREIAERSGYVRSAARAINVLAIIRYERRDLAGARAYSRRALELALDVGDDELVGLACQNAGVVAEVMGDLREARIAFLESIGSFVRSGDTDSASLGYNNLGVVSAGMGEWLEAEVYFSRGIEIAERLHNSPRLAKLYGNRAEPLIFVGELQQAAESLRLAEETAEAVGDRFALAVASRWRAVMARLEGAHDEAERHLERALSLVPHAAPERADAFYELSRLREAQGRSTEAREAYDHAAEIDASLGGGAHPVGAGADAGAEQRDVVV